MDYNDGLSKVIGACICAVVGVVMLATFVIPVCADQIALLTGDYAKWNTLLTVVITMTVVSLVIGVISYFTHASKR